jgi:hypothetical protein
MNRIGALQRVLRSKEEATTDEAEQEKENQEVAAVAEKTEAERQADRIGQIEAIDHAQFQIDMSPTQCWGMPLIHYFNDEVETIPKYRFTRSYFGLKIIVDTFKSEVEYHSADVEGRRKLAEHFGWKYAALGPNHTRFPYNDENLKKRYPSLVEQLGVR